MKINKFSCDCTVDYKESNIMTLLGRGFIACETRKKDFVLRGSHYNMDVVLITYDNTQLMWLSDLVDIVSKDKVTKPLSLYELLVLNHKFPGLRAECPIVIPGFALVSKAQYFGNGFMKNKEGNFDFYIVSIGTLDALGFALAADVMAATFSRTAIDMGVFDGEVLEQNLSRIK